MNEYTLRGFIAEAVEEGQAYIALLLAELQASEPLEVGSLEIEVGMTNE